VTRPHTPTPRRQVSSVRAVSIDVASTSDWIKSLGIEVTEPLHFERMGLGQSNLTYRASDVAGRRWVLRRPPIGLLLASAHDVEREARILYALEDTDVPTPRVLGIKLDGGAPVALIEYVDGVVVDQVSVARALTPAIRRCIGLSMVKTLGKIHAVDLKTTGLIDLASHRPYAERQLKRWSGQWEASKTRELRLLDGLTARLRGAVPEQQHLTLVHGDFHLRNVITSRESGCVLAALDWELSTLGDPLADVGTLLAYWPQGQDATAEGFNASALPGFLEREELVDAYVAQTGRDPSALGFWHALGLWKIAIIAEGIVRRTTDEPQNRAAAGTPTVARIDALVERANAVATAAGL
jgi:aminoglycoside phosphotransferase (APT) family kinase protein